MNNKLKSLLAEVVHGSGFPFQAKMESIIEAAPGWEVAGIERSWKYEGREEFIDIVARKNNLHLAIECKKVGVLSKESKTHGVEWFGGAPRRSYLFLIPQVAAQTNLTVCTAFHEPNERDEPDAPEGTHGDLWQLMPASYEAALCVTADANDPKHMLERDISLLVRGTHQYADAHFRFLFSVGALIREIYVPVYLTTAPLFVLKLNLDEVSIEGEFKPKTDAIESVPWIRFRKAFMAEGSLGPDDRTVFVVHARHFEQFLQQFDAAPLPKPEPG